MADEIAYRELKAGEVIQPGDEWQTESGQWALFHQAMIWQQARDGRCRRPYNITRMTQERDGLANAVNDLLKKNHHLTKELARLQQPPPPADHIVDADKMAESKLEQKAWELWLRGDVLIEDAWRKAEYFIAERNRRRQASMAAANVVGDSL